MTDQHIAAAAALRRELAQRGDVLALLDIVLASAPVAFALLDPALRYVHVNERFAAVNGLPVEAHLGRPIAEVVPEIAAAVAPLLWRILETGEPMVNVDVNGPFIGRPAEARHWLASAYPVRGQDGTILGIAILCPEITAQRRAEAALRANEERFRLAARATRDVIFDWNVTTDEHFWGDTITEAFGYDPQQVEMTTAWWMERIHPDDVARVSASLRNALDGDGTAWSVEYRFRRSDDTYATVLDRGYLLRDEQGHAVRLVGSMIDLTEQKELEAQLRQSQKMDALGQLAGAVAHDFNNLLTAIKMHAALALEEPELPGAAIGDLQEIQKAADRSATLTQQLLAFSRKQHLDLQVIDVNAIVSGLEPLLRRLIGAEIDVRPRLGTGLGHVRADAGQLEQVLMNLVVNARDAMPSGGTLTLTTANLELAEWDLKRPPTGLLPGPYVTLSVTDTGCGMSAEVRARIFEPFFTTKPAGKGTGLGLPTVYGIVQQSGGHLTVESAPGVGSTFTIYLPRV